MKFVKPNMSFAPEMRQKMAGMIKMYLKRIRNILLAII